MSNIGSILRDARCKCHLSLKDVHERCGITDSKLSRMERGEGRVLTPSEIKAIAQLYGISVVPLYILAGYMNEGDLSEYQFIFKNADLLNEEEKQSIQTQIDLLTKGRQVNKNGI